jgi:hypothetical protein
LNGLFFKNKSARSAQYFFAGFPSGIDGSQSLLSLFLNHFPAFISYPEKYHGRFFLELPTRHPLPSYSEGQFHPHIKCSGPSPGIAMLIDQYESIDTTPVPAHINL